ncbi:hypothetical protein OG754_00200 [Streptomyces decoyicus]|uniref:hypothetical protein n=1 Tax=Streptomyces decoyicus TaxID=249567 RepID=UPI002E304B72|nr:hypothetical protein [Streptomyces decoyicus]
MIDSKEGLMSGARFMRGQPVMRALTAYDQVCPKIAWLDGGVVDRNRVGPVLRKLAVRLEEVVRSANAWDAPAAASPPKSTSPPRDDADPSRSL